MYDLVITMIAALLLSAALGTAYTLPAYDEIQDAARYATPEEYAAAVADTRFTLQKVPYRSGGLQVFAYVYAPASRKEGFRYPAVIYNRGSWTRDEFAGELLTSFHRLATSGFIVIAPMYRGSGGAEGRDDLGGADVEDLMATAGLARDLGFVDPANLFLYGESRGGMMVYQALRDGFPARAAAVYGGFTDFLGLIESVPRMAGAAKMIWPDFEQRRNELAERRSAVMWADRIKAPLLIMHGGDDRDVPPAQALALASKLQAAGAKYELIIRAGANHVLTQWRHQRDTHAVEWFRRHMEPYTQRVNEAAIDALMRDYAGQDGRGASVLVMRNGEAVFRRGYGGATTDTNYRLASVTKQFTAAAILRLDEQGKLSLDDRIRKYLPSLPAELDAVTVRHLLTHSSGIIDYEDVIPEETTAQLLDRDVLHLLESQRSTYFAPGASYRYSNSGYALLALIVERVSKKSFADFLRDEIFRPLGMTATVAHQEGVSTVARRAYGHPADQSRTSAVLGDGGVYSSVDDLANWLAALDRGEFAQASIPRVATENPKVKYGYGWRISEHNGRQTVMHTGETIGFRNAVMRMPKERLAIVILTNRNEGEPVALARAIHSAL